ncbi:MAG: Gfo/Idh/MocA family oxidoreductase [Calditrichaeota bacterium]|nr:Gfo/Idh/MocA family oxidoreductase [Calditrichota bacterium]
MSKSDSQLSRRDFIKSTTGAAAAAAITAPMFVPKEVFGANDRIRVAVLGVHSRGRSHIKGYMELENVQVTTLCDPDKNVLQERAAQFKETYGKKVKTVQDLRKVFDDKKIDAVSIATPNHWHSLATVWACQAGKDVYVEKPMSHNVWEGRKAVEAARKYNRIVQHGTQSRSSEGRAKEIAAVHSEKYGKLLASKGYCCKPRWSIGFKPYKTPPPYLDFNLWLGPANQEPYHENLVHYNWHWFWPTGNGDIGNQGVHQMDLARWAIKGATLPTKVWGMGGRYGYRDQGETANTEMSVCRYGDVLLIFEVRGLVGKTSKERRKVGNEYFTTEGMIANGKFYPKNGGAPEPLQDLGGTVNPGGNFGNFINAVRSRKREELNAEILEGHYSSALCHLGNISMRMGKDVPWSKYPLERLQNEIAFDTFQALEKNLAWANGLNLHDMSYQLGPVLDFDPQTEKFINNERADSYLSRVYRKPFVVPEMV